jgi:UDP-glucose 4-epimerase
MKKIVVTGGAGFIGSHICDELVAQGHQVWAADNLSTGNKKNLSSKINLAKVDLKDSKQIQQFIEEIKPEAIFHLAAQVNVRTSLESPLKDAKNNILGSINLFKAAGKEGAKKIVYSSTGGAVYGDPEKNPCQETDRIAPLCPYGVSKYSVEKYLEMYAKLFNFNWIVLRYANVYGPRQDPKGEAGVVSIFTEQLLNNKQPYINGDGEQTRDFVYVKDVARANLKALESNNSNEVFNIGTGQPTSINKLYTQIKEAIGSEIDPKHHPAIAGEVKDTYLDISKAKDQLYWKPRYSLDRGIKETVAWMKADFNPS